jgi:hypothetical protein
MMEALQQIQQKPASSAAGESARCGDASLLTVVPPPPAAARAPWRSSLLSEGVRLGVTEAAALTAAAAAARVSPSLPFSTSTPLPRPRGTPARGEMREDLIVLPQRC